MLRCDRLCGGHGAIRQKKETVNRTRCPASGISAWTWPHPPDTSVSRLTLGFVFCYFRPSTKLSNSKWKLLEEICKFTLSTTLSCLKGLISAPSHAGCEPSLCPVWVRFNNYPVIESRSWSPDPLEDFQILRPISLGSSSCLFQKEASVSV